MLWFWKIVYSFSLKIVKISQNKIKNTQIFPKVYTDSKDLWYDLDDNSDIDNKGGCFMNATAVAYYIINRANQKCIPISNLKLQKILYFLWIEYYKLTGQPLFNDEISAWQLGPVVPEVYYEFCPFGSSAIRHNYDDSGLENDIKEKLNPFLDELLNKSASSLVDLTHKPGTPWSIIFNDGSGNRRQIPYGLITALEC